MKVTLSTTRPTTKPIREYETRILYVGGRFRYDTHTKTLSSLEKHSDGSITYTEMPATTQVFSQTQHSEHVRVVVYAESPKVWVEELSPTDYFVFAQQPTHAA